MTTNYLPEIVAQLLQIDPAKIILFGSHASGAANDTSDLDLIVVLRDDRSPASHREREDVYLTVARVRRDIRRETPVDLIVHTQPMHRKFVEQNSSFAREVLQKGIVLYEADNAGMVDQDVAWNREEKPMTRLFTAVLHREDDLQVAECPEVGTVSQGYTVEEALVNLREATELYLAEFPLPRTERPFVVEGFVAEQEDREDAEEIRRLHEAGEETIPWEQAKTALRAEGIAAEVNS